ncbi:MAG TPA: hypothetical protein VGM82_05665 [Gemmatimonadaceae bacterium]|jgi:hypothetical protein
MILDETRERFIKAIAKQVDPARIAEIHFFAPIRQGGVESGVAVIAAMERAPAPVIVLDEVFVDDSIAENVVEAVAESEEESPYGDVVEVSSVDQSAGAEEPERESEPTLDTEQPQQSEPEPDSQPEPVAVAETAAPTPIERHVIYTARYRLTLKGPDRGRWEAHVNAEADAPIITVDAVVRGVQRRAGDVDDPTRMTGEEIRSAVPATV